MYNIIDKKTGKLYGWSCEDNELDMLKRQVELIIKDGKSKGMDLELVKAGAIFDKKRADVDYTICLADEPDCEACQ